MLPTQRRDPRIMDLRPSNVAGREQRPQAWPVRPRLTQQHDCWRFEPSLDLVKSLSQWCGWRINTRMRDNREEFMHAWPRNGPIRRGFRKLGDPPECGSVKRGVLAMGVDENVGIDGDHAPRSWYAASRSRSQEASRNSACRPCPLKLARRSLNGASGFVSATTR